MLTTQTGQAIHIGRHRSGLPVLPRSDEAVFAVRVPGPDDVAYLFRAEAKTRQAGHECNHRR
ncbi:hypothetical protein BH11PSE7_BH11PSE7_03150 [soil metagenome]